jgi:hypothetical protein
LLICPSLPTSSKSALHLQVFDFLGIILGRPEVRAAADARGVQRLDRAEIGSMGS